VAIRAKVLVNHFRVFGVGLPEVFYVQFFHRAAQRRQVAAVEAVHEHQHVGVAVVHQVGRHVGGVGDKGLAFSGEAEVILQQVPQVGVFPLFVFGGGQVQ
jgi:hypothetical protein